MLVHPPDVGEAHHLEADHQHQCGQCGQRDPAQPAGQRDGGQHDPQAVQDGRPARPGTRPDVGRAAYGAAGHRQPAEQAADDVRQALAAQLAVQVAGALGHPVHRDGGEQRLDARHRRHGQHGRQDAGEGAVRQLGQALRLPGGQLDPGEPQAQRHRQRGGGGDGHQCTGDPCQPGAQLPGPAGQPPQPGPAAEDGDGERADDQCRRMRRGQLPGQCQQVGERRALR